MCTNLYLYNTIKQTAYANHFNLEKWWARIKEKLENGELRDDIKNLCKGIHMVVSYKIGVKPVQELRKIYAYFQINKNVIMKNNNADFFTLFLWATVESRKLLTDYPIPSYENGKLIFHETLRKPEIRACNVILWAIEALETLKKIGPDNFSNNMPQGFRLMAKNYLQHNK